MNRSAVNKVLLARRLFDIAREHLNSVSELSLGIGVNLLQDSVEAFLLAVSDHLNAGVGANTSFDKYFELIEKKIAPKELPFRARLLALNKLRVNSKHYGLAPAKSVVEGLPITVREFFEEVSKTVFGVTLATISLVDLLRDGEVKEFLKEGEAAFVKGEFGNCLIACRKAIYVRFEWAYDVAPYAEDEKSAPLFSSAPFFARSKKFVDESVLESTGYIVLDHSEFEIELMKAGIDSVSFWNIWRLTPEIHRDRKSKEWRVKNDLGKFEPDGIGERAEYVLDTAISLFLADDHRHSSTKTPDHGRRYYINLHRDQIPVYKKADPTSQILCTTPADLKRLHVDYSVPSMDGKSTFWHVSHFDKGVSLWGFIKAEEIIVE